MGQNGLLSKIKRQTLSSLSVEKTELIKSINTDFNQNVIKEIYSWAKIAIIRILFVSLQGIVWLHAHFA